MNFLALIVGLAAERLATRLFHLRAFHWLDPVFDRVTGSIVRLPGWAVYPAAIGAIILLVLPVMLIELALHDRLAYIPAFLFAVAVLLICLGPRDLVQEVADYRRALEEESPEAAVAAAGELLDEHLPEGAGHGDLEAAVYTQANNRIFGVVFWFLVLGAAGAWLFRVLDLMRQRVVCRMPADGGPDAAGRAVLLLHAAFAWLPARLLMVGYALAGSYVGAVAAWRSAESPANALPGEADRRLLGAVGRGAAVTDVGQPVSERLQTAVDLVMRTLWMIWCPILALLTLSGWLI